jgi:membrane-associated phospholipid phosphatase
MEKMRKILSLCLFLFFFLQFHITSASFKEAKEEGKEYLINSYKNISQTVASPWHWDKKNWGEFIIFTSLTGQFFLVDKNLNNFFQENRNKSTDKLAKWVGPFGQNYCPPLLNGMLLTGIVLKNQKLRETAILSWESVWLTQAITIMMKLGFGRIRPAEGESFKFEPFKYPYPDNSLSFPSGHASTAFSVASVIASQYDKTWIKFLSYGLAGLVAWSRLNDNAHWTSDVLFSAVLGTAIGRKIVKLNQQRKSKKITLYPSFESNMKIYKLNLLF